MVIKEMKKSLFEIVLLCIICLFVLTACDAQIAAEGTAEGASERNGTVGASIYLPGQRSKAEIAEMLSSFSP